MNTRNITLLIAFCGLILLPNLMAWSHQTVDSITINLVVVFLCLSLQVRLGLGIFLLIPFALLAPLEAIYILVYGQPSSAHLLGVLIETNPKELASFMDGIGFQLAGVVLVSAVFIGYVLCKSIREQWKWEGRLRGMFLVTGVLVLSILFLQDSVIDDVEPVNYSTSINRQITQGDGRLLTTNTLIESYPAGLVFRFNSFLNQKRGLKKAAEVIEGFRFGAKKIEDKAAKEIHVLVIGETGRADRWQINGYERETNPLLSQTEGVVSFSDTITGWAWTRMSVPVIITRKKSNNNNAFFAEKSVVSAFKEAGFKTYWLTTQGPLGLHESSVALHAQEADDTRFLSLTDYKGGNIYDGVLLEPLKEILDKEDQKQFIVLHTLGSHYDYSNRYPMEFDRYLPSMKGSDNTSLHNIANKKILNNSYDNSILYTDFVLANVIMQLQKTGKQATLFYTSDHGENIFDNNCEFSGHGHATESDFKVASIWWNSQAYEQANPEKISLIKSRKSQPLTTEHVFHTILDVANISYPSEALDMSIASSFWKPSLRWTQTGLDFDISARDPVCKKLIAADN